MGTPPRLYFIDALRAFDDVARAFYQWFTRPSV